MAVGTSIRSIASKMQYTVTAKSRPMPSAIPRSRAVNGGGRPPMRSQAANSASPTTLRNDSNVNTSPPALNTTFPSTSAHAKVAAATTPGTRLATAGAAGWEVMDKQATRSAMDERAGAEVRQKLEQHRVLDLSVEDDDALD